MAVLVSMLGISSRRAGEVVDDPVIAEDERTLGSPRQRFGEAQFVGARDGRRQRAHVRAPAVRSIS